MSANVEELRAVEGIGETVAEEVREFFDGERNRMVVADLRDHGVEPQAAESTSDALAELTFVFTGSLAERTREEATELVEANSGSATSSVSGNTDYLVVGENPGRSKREDAEANNVPTLGEGEFEALLEDRGVEV